MYYDIRGLIVERLEFFSSESAISIAYLGKSDNVADSDQSHMALFQICEDFKHVSRKLFDRPNAIEDAADIREYIKSLPDTITLNQQKIDKVMSDYELLEDFYYNLSTDDFNAKYVSLSSNFLFSDLHISPY